MIEGAPAPTRRDPGTIERRRDEQPPVFEAGSVAIRAIGNLTVETGRNLGRREDVGVDFPAGEVNAANRGEIKFWQSGMERLARDKGEDDSVVQAYRGFMAAREQWKQECAAWAALSDDERQTVPPPAHPVAPAEMKFPLTQPGLGIKAGIRDFHVEGDRLVVDTIPVTFPTYSQISNERDPRKALEVAGALGNAMILFTADGKMIVQHRSAKNRSYGNMIGASAAGLMDAELYSTEDRAGDREKRGKMKPLTQEGLVAHMQQELFEEVKLSPEQVTSYLTGFAEDKRKPHYEALWMAETSLTSEDVKRNAVEVRTGKELSERDFDEQFFVLNGNREAIERLLTESRCPIPPTHSAAFLSALYVMTERAEGKAGADSMLRDLQPRLQANLDAIDAQVREYYEADMSRLPAKYNGRMPVGYDPAFLPEQQGLPSVQQELERLGLVEGD